MDGVRDRDRVGLNVRETVGSVDFDLDGLNVLLRLSVADGRESESDGVRDTSIESE